MILRKTISLPSRDDFQSETFFIIIVKALFLFKVTFYKPISIDFSNINSYLDRLVDASNLPREIRYQNRWGSAKASDFLARPYDFSEGPTGEDNRKIEDLVSHSHNSVPDLY